MGRGCAGAGAGGEGDVRILPMTGIAPITEGKGAGRRLSITPPS